MYDNVKVSFILPIFRIDSNLLHMCIQSIINQTEPNIEIILIDDGSPDDCGNICDQYMEKDKRIIVVHQENMGVSVARNKGIEIASGVYICFVDPDDLVMNDLAEKTTAAIEESDADLLIYKYINNKERLPLYNCNISLIDENEKLEFCRSIIDMKDTSEVFGACWGKLFRRDFLVAHHLSFVPGIKKAQDKIFMYDCYKSDAKCAQFDYFGYIYTMDNDTSICRKFNPDIRNILEATYEEFQKRADTEELQKSLYNACAMFMFEYCILYYCHKDNNKSVSERAKELKKLVQDEPYKSAVKLADRRVVRKKCALMLTLLKMKSYKLCVEVMSKLL